MRFGLLLGIFGRGESRSSNVWTSEATEETSQTHFHVRPQSSETRTSLTMSTTTKGCLSLAQIAIFVISCIGKIILVMILILETDNQQVVQIIVLLVSNEPQIQ